MALLSLLDGYLYDQVGQDDESKHKPEQGQYGISHPQAHLFVFNVHGLYPHLLLCEKLSFLLSESELIWIK